MDARLHHVIARQRVADLHTDAARAHVARCDGVAPRNADRMPWAERWLHEIAARFTPINDHQQAEDS